MNTTLAQKLTACQIEFIEFMEIASAPYVFAGVVVGLIFGEIIRPLRVVHLLAAFVKSFKREKPAPIVDANTLIRCGACQSVIMTGPIMRMVTNGNDTLIYQCQQCASQVAVVVTPT